MDYNERGLYSKLARRMNELQEFALSLAIKPPFASDPDGLRENIQPVIMQHSHSTAWV